MINSADLGQPWLHNAFTKLCHPVFVPVKRRIFVTYSRSKANIERIRKGYRHKEPEAVDENTSNHEHVDWFGSNRLESVQKNYIMAESIRLVWQHLLAKRYPNRRFRLFVVHEYDIETANDSSRDGARVIYQGITTTIRLWSIVSAEEDERFGNSYHLDQLSSNNAIWTGQWIYKINVGLLDLKKVCDLIKRTEAKGISLGALKRALMRARKR